MTAFGGHQSVNNQRTRVAVRLILCANLNLELWHSCQFNFNTFSQKRQDLSVGIVYEYTPTGAGYGSGTGGVPAVPS